MKRRTFIKNTGAVGLFTFITPSGLLHQLKQPVMNSLEEDFLHPPVSAQPHTWWHWMNGHVTKEGITLDLEAMKKVGIGGFQNFFVGSGIPKGPVEYLSEEWLNLMKHTIAEADRLGLEFQMHNCPGWSSTGGPWITPELSMQQVVWSETFVEGGKEVKTALPQPFKRLNYYRDTFILAFPSLEGEK
ncbi:MAG: glycosyl hydrolase family 43, partial [Bacteroidota bacterium]|nr:glycosyl hydrolase family 43 [Bacteroidota bacterium]